MSNTLPPLLQPVLASNYPLRPRLLFLLQRQAGATVEQFEQALTRCRRQFPADAVATGAVIARAGIRIEEEQAFIGKIFRGAPVAPIDGYLALDLESYAPSDADFERLIALAKTALEPASGVIDLPQSTVYAGIVNLAIPGYAPIAMILLLNHAAHLTQLQYNEWWVHHGDDHRQMNRGQVGYHQLHSAPEYNDRAAQASGAKASEQRIIDMMYLGDIKYAVSAGDPESPDTKRVGAEIGQHVGFNGLRGSFFREL